MFDIVELVVNKTYVKNWPYQANINGSLGHILDQKLTDQADSIKNTILLDLTFGIQLFIH